MISGNLNSRQVLVSDGGAGQNRSAVAAVRALAAGGYRAAVTVSGPTSLAAASRFCKAAIAVPPVEDERYRHAVYEEFKRGDYLTVLPGSDAALLALGIPVRHLIDKSQLARRASAVGLSTLPTSVYESPIALLEAAQALRYPLVVKPKVSSESAVLVHDPAQLPTKLQGPGPFAVQPYLEEPMSAVAGTMWRGKMVGAVHMRYLRTWPAECGPSCASETVEGDEQRERLLAELLAEYNGIFEAQFVGDHIIDLNLRIYGSLPLSVAAGVNLVAIFCDLVRGESVPDQRGRPGVPYRWIEGDVRHVWHQVRGRNMTLTAASHALMPRTRSAHSTESLSDPMPMLRRIQYGLGHL